MTSGCEVEIKLPVPDVEEMRRRLAEAGARVDTERGFEDNWMFDFDDGRLAAREALLRLRRSPAGWLLTLKERPPVDSRYKVRHEVETALADGDALRAVTEALGMRVVYRYQKYRSTYRAGDLHVTVDELPIGNYLELEGSPDEIDRFAGALGFAPHDYINVSYRTLHVEALQANGQNPEPAEMIFPRQTS